ncbi:MAG: hypothetical protein JKX70_06520 [Phycisphaerales bacterium]|nr:hypothetical protein [Phycisphaerales bacterium]
MAAIFIGQSKLTTILTTLVGGLVIASASHANAQCDPQPLGNTLLSDNPSLNDCFGCVFGVDFSGNTAVVGATLDSTTALEAGAAYVFDRSGTNWNQTIKLLPDDGMALDHFGWSTVISSSRLAVGAVAGSGPAGQNTGTVYTYRRLFAWGLQEKLQPDDAQPFDNFGFSLDLSLTTLAVGAPGADIHGANSGAVYIYQLLNFAWVLEAKLVPMDGQAGDEFGATVELSNGRIVIGARSDDDNGMNSGSAYVYERLPGGDWIQRSKLLAEDGAENDGFGSSVSIWEDTVAVGALGDDISGSAYVFTSNDNGLNWSQNAKLVPDNGEQSDRFGAVSTNGDTVIVGADSVSTDQGFNSGSAYVFTRAGNGWVQRAQIVPNNPSGDLRNFGFHTVLDGNNNAIIGSFQAAYVYDLDCLPCPADLSGDGVLNFFDVSAFLTFFQINNPIADMNDDGVFNFFDVSAYLSAFSAGCP